MVKGDEKVGKKKRTGETMGKVVGGGGAARRWCDAENGAGVYRDGMNVCTSLCVRVGV